jgi:hypothetical protein
VAKEIKQVIGEGIEPVNCILKPESRHGRWPVEITGKAWLFKKIKKAQSILEMLIVNDMDEVIKRETVSKCGNVD